MSTPTVTLEIRPRRNGIAGQYAYDATAVYEFDNGSIQRHAVTFYGSTYGGPIIMQTDTRETIVSRAVLDRIGATLTPDWIRAFYGA